MIKFFRKIRERLISENKFSKYLVYAVGEIVLVVIGILIALQINNLNENHKAFQEEKTTIKSLKLEFQKNLQDLESNIKDITAIKSAGEYLLQYTGPDYQNGSLKSVDSIISMTPRMAVWDPSLYTLSNIKNSGKLASLSNEQLKVLLIEWESFYANLLDWGDFYVDAGQRYFDYLETYSNNRNLNLGTSMSLGPSRFTFSNEALLKELSFENKIVERVTVNGFMLRYYQEAKTRLKQIIAECEVYEE